MYNGVEYQLKLGGFTNREKNKKVDCGNVSAPFMWTNYFSLWSR